MNLKHKAAEIIRGEIDRKGESAHLLCLLGDATNDLNHYRRALEVSDFKSSRAFKSIGENKNSLQHITFIKIFIQTTGMSYYFKKEYAEAVENFQKSLNLNSFQLDVLLRMGNLLKAFLYLNFFY